MDLRWLKKVICVGLLINVLILFVNFYVFKQFEITFNQHGNLFKASQDRCEIEVWSKASLGDYFWEHVMRAAIQKTLGDGFYRFGKKVMIEERLVFKFRSGYSITPETLGKFFKSKESSAKKHNLVLILNGRTKSSAQTADSYLRPLVQFKDRLNLGVILLGNENCFNSWIKPHLDSDLIKFLFVVYDWNQVDNEKIFQWPLGVATYRNFPLVQPNKDLIKSDRKHLCNYLATIYKNSSREELMDLLEHSDWKHKCLMKVRMQWSPDETNETLAAYQEALRNSDLTLSPLGVNHECYRIYEAFSYLSVPILEENLNHVRGKRSNCDQNSAYRLLKEFNAPVRYVGNWTRDLHDILMDELDRTADDRMNKRIELFNWYENFKKSMRSRFIQVLKRKFECSIE